MTVLCISRERQAFGTEVDVENIDSEERINALMEKLKPGLQRKLGQNGRLLKGGGSSDATPRGEQTIWSGITHQAAKANGDEEGVVDEFYHMLKVIVLQEHACSPLNSDCESPKDKEETKPDQGTGLASEKGVCGEVVGRPEWVNGEGLKKDTKLREAALAPAPAPAPARAPAPIPALKCKTRLREAGQNERGKEGAPTALPEKENIVVLTPNATKGIANGDGMEEKGGRVEDAGMNNKNGEEDKTDLANSLSLDDFDFDNFVTQEMLEATINICTQGAAHEAAAEADGKQKREGMDDVDSETELGDPLAASAMKHRKRRFGLGLKSVCPPGSPTKRYKEETASPKKASQDQAQLSREMAITPPINEGALLRKLSATLSGSGDFSIPNSRRAESPTSSSRSDTVDMVALMAEAKGLKHKADSTRDSLGNLKCVAVVYYTLSCTCFMNYAVSQQRLADQEKDPLKKESVLNRAAQLVRQTISMLDHTHARCRQLSASLECNDDRTRAAIAVVTAGVLHLQAAARMQQLMSRRRKFRAEFSRLKNNAVEAKLANGSHCGKCGISESDNVAAFDLIEAMLPAIESCDRAASQVASTRKILGSTSFGSMGDKIMINALDVVSELANWQNMGSTLVIVKEKLQRLEILL